VYGGPLLDGRKVTLDYQCVRPFSASMLLFAPGCSAGDGTALAVSGADTISARPEGGSPESYPETRTTRVAATSNAGSPTRTPTAE
jgi:hypothetical protein